MKYQIKAFENAICAEDPDDLTEEMTDLLWPVNIRPFGKGRYVFGRMAFYKAGETVLTTSTAISGSVSRSLIIPDVYCIILPENGSAELCLEKNLIVDTKPDNIGLFYATDVGYLAARPQTTYSMISIPTSVMSYHFTKAFDRAFPTDFRFNSSINRSSEVGMMINQIVSGLQISLTTESLLNKMPLTSDLLSDAIIHTLLEAGVNNLQHLAKPTMYRGSTKQFKAAIDYMQANLNHPITISEIAEAVKLHRRSLQEVFRRNLGVTPMAYLRKLRLEAAHKDLVDDGNDKKIAQIALSYGFLHSSQFSLYYKQQYGKKPSETRGFRSK